MRPLCYARNFQIGFTLIEVLVTITMLAILLAIAAPNLRTFVVQNQMAALSNEFLAALTLTRTEAIKAGPGRRATMAAEGGDWGKGWRIYIDQNSNGALDGGERQVKLREALDPNMDLTSNLNTISYNASGEAETFLMGAWQATQTATITFCLDGVRRSIVISRIGRPRVDVDKVATC